MSHDRVGPFIVCTLYLVGYIIELVIFRVYILVHCARTRVVHASQSATYSFGNTAPFRASAWPCNVHGGIPAPSNMSNGTRTEERPFKLRAKGQMMTL